MAHKFIPRGQQFGVIRDRRRAACRHDLRLESLRQHNSDKMPHDVPRLLFDEQWSFEHIALGRILGLDEVQFSF